MSSFRPFGHSKEVDQNVLNAKASWEEAFDKITYLNSIEPQLASPKTEFIQSEDYPRIKDMLAVLDQQKTWGCLINADIVVSPSLRRVERSLRNVGAVSAFSYRWQFDSLAQIAKAKVADNGLDFFAAVPAVWERAAQECPDDFRIGHCLFDTWLWCFLKGYTRRLCFNITQERVIFHPRHGDRKSQHAIADHKDNPWFAHAGTPVSKLPAQTACQPAISAPTGKV